MTQQTDPALAEPTTDLIAWFEDLTRDDVPRAGGKGANLGELTSAGMPVPGGFVVTAAAYLQAMDAAGVRAAMQDAAAVIDAESPESLAAAAAGLQALVHSAGMPDALGRAVRGAYARLGSDVRVAVRSSATAEDTAATSFAGMNETFTNVRGPDDAARADRRLLGLAVGPAGSGLPGKPAACRTSRRSRSWCSGWWTPTRSGVMFTADPATGDRGDIVIEAAFGLGEVVVGGQVEPDTYVVSKDGPRIVQVHVGTKAHKIVRGPDGHDQRLRRPRRRAGAPGARRRGGAGAGPHGHARSSGTTARRRTSSGPSRAGARGSCSRGRSPPWAMSARRRKQPRRRDPCSSPAWPPRPASPPGRCASCAAGRGPQPGQGRGARGADDEPGLGADDAAGGRARHRRRRHDLPRRDRQPRAATCRASWATRNATTRPARRRDGHRRRRQGRGARGRRTAAAPAVTTPAAAVSPTAPAARRPQPPRPPARGST